MTPYPERLHILAWTYLSLSLRGGRLTGHTSALHLRTSICVG